MFWTVLTLVTIRVILRREFSFIVTFILKSRFAFSGSVTVRAILLSWSTVWVSDRFFVSSLVIYIKLVRLYTSFNVIVLFELSIILDFG